MITSPTTKVILQMADTMTLCLRPTSSTPVNEKVIWIMRTWWLNISTSLGRTYDPPLSWLTNLIVVSLLWESGSIKTYLVHTPKDTFLLQNQLPRNALWCKPSNLERMLWTCRRWNLKSTLCQWPLCDRICQIRPLWTPWLQTSLSCVLSRLKFFCFLRNPDWTVWKIWWCWLVNENKTKIVP